MLIAGRYQGSPSVWRSAGVLGLASLLLVLAAPRGYAQGVLTVTPGRSVATAAGMGSAGYSGDDGSATASTLAGPSGIVYDSAGDLFVADAQNHVVREISVAGVITTVAGTGIAGYGGDGGAATKAFLDTPTSVAVGAQGKIYIADSHNHRIREVSNGTITTIAGTGTPGFAGDGGPGTSAHLALPSGVAVDLNGNVYIADTNNQRVRKLSSGTITTVAGNGEELFDGDGGAATAASLDQPTGVALDAVGNLYIADKNNHRIRVVTGSGTISTLAGTGTGAFAGGFSGDGSAATSASLAKPVSISVDAAGNLFVADTNNQRVRQISADGTIATVVGTGDQGYTGDGGPALLAILNSPRAVANDSARNLTVADTRNQRLRTAALGSLSFTSTAVGSASAPQSVTLNNTGKAALTISSLMFTGPFLATAGASCSALPIVLAPGTSCTQNVAFLPTTSGQASGSLAVAGQGLVKQTVLLSGVSSQTATSLLLAADKTVVLTGETVTLSATLKVSGTVASSATGTVTFYAGTRVLGSSTLTQGKATLAISSIQGGTQSLTAVFSATGGYDASTSAAISESVANFTLSANVSPTLSVVPGHSVAIPLTTPVTGAGGLSGTVRLSSTTLVQGLAVSFVPASLPLSNGQLGFTMNVTAAPTGTAAAELPLLGSLLLLLFVTLPGDRRQSILTLRTRPILLLLVSVSGLLSAGALSGCGSNTGFFGQKPQTYNIIITATATDSTGGTLSRSTPVSITVQ